MMFCKECGKTIEDGSKFCKDCGASLLAAQIAESPPPRESEEKNKKSGFFYSPAGIALIAILAVAVIAGITLGMIFLLRSGPNDTVDAETLQVWDEYQNIADQDSTNLATINYDPNALNKAREDLNKTLLGVEALEKVLRDNGDTPERRQRTARMVNNTRDQKADQMAAVLAAYNAYIRKLNELFGTLVGANLLDPNVVNTLNAQLKELQTLSVKVKDLSNQFLANNGKIAITTFDPPVLAVAVKIASDVEKNVQAAQAAEKQRLESETAAAQQQAAAAAAEAERQRQEQAQYVTCPNCGGVGTVEGGDGRYTCGFCGGSGRVTRSKAASYNPADWRDY